MREFRGDGGRGESATNDSSKADSEFNRVDWKGSSERETNNNITTSMRTDRKDARGEHRGGGGGGGENWEVTWRRGESRSGAGGGDISSSGSRERKPSDDLQRMSSGAQQETGQEVRESWGSRTFLKGSSSQASALTGLAAGPVAGHGAEEEGAEEEGADEEGEIDELSDELSDQEIKWSGKLNHSWTRVGDELIRDDVIAEMSSHNNSINNNSTVTEREERQTQKSDRRCGDLQVHISFVPPSQQLHLQREKERDEKSAEREKERAKEEREKEKEPSISKQKDKAKEKEEPISTLVREKSGSGNKESEVDSTRRGDKEGGGDGYNNNRRKEPADQEEKDEKNLSATEKGVEKRGGVSVDFEHFDSAAGTSAGAGGGGVKKALQEENSSKVGGERETVVKERAAVVESKEQQHETKGKIEPAVEEAEKEKGKRKLRDYDRAAVGAGEDTPNSNADGEDYERDVVSSYGIQRKRLLRPRGHYQGSNNREVRARFRVKDSETYNPTRATVENSTLVYRAGEGLQEELRRIRKEFDDRKGKLAAEPQQQSALVPAPTTIEVRIPAELATTSNRQVQGSQLWGTDTYTDDSDLVAVLMHTGYYAPTSSSQVQTILELRATVRVLSPQERYTSTLRNSLRSRAWGTASGCAFSVDSCYLVKKDGGKVQLEPRLTFTPAFAPTLAPAVTERTVTTRAVSMNAYRAQRFVQEVTIQYNLCNEPWLKYSMNIVADKGLKKSQYTSARLKKSDVLYVETHSHRYELSYEDSKTGAAFSETKAPLEKGKEKAETADKGLEKVVEKGQIQGGSSKESVAAGNSHNNGPLVGDKYRWALCKRPLSLRSMRAKGVPLPLEYVKVLESGLLWEEVQWSPAGVCVRGKEYPLARAHFVPMHE